MVRIEHFELRAPQVVALQLPLQAVIRVTAGRLWLTLENRPEDVWLGPGESWEAGEPCKAWLSAETLADFQIAQPAGRKVIERSASKATFMHWPSGARPA